MNTHPFKIIMATAIVSVLIGAAGAMAFSNQKNESMGGMLGGHIMPDGTMMGDSMAMEMDGMMKNLEGKTGDVFDKAFLADMILHHQGAVAMAEAALKNAKHQEIKDLAKAIITAQNAEIQRMQEWQASWYGQ